MAVPKNNPDYPKVVWARAPELVPRYIRLAVSEKTLSTLFATQRFAAMGEYAGLILGQGVLIRPSAIYQGLKRPFHGPGMDETVYAYVSRPAMSFTYRLAARVSPADLRQLPPPAARYLLRLSPSPPMW